ncbi:hypothetical protein ACQCRE_25225, partial [Ralstonia pseudosolanacearum]
LFFELVLLSKQVFVGCHVVSSGKIVLVEITGPALMPHMQKSTISRVDPDTGILMPLWQIRSWFVSCCRFFKIADRPA